MKCIIQTKTECLYSQRTFREMSKEQLEYFSKGSLDQPMCTSCGDRISDHREDKAYDRTRRFAWTSAEETLLRKLIPIMPYKIDFNVIMYHWKLQKLPIRTKKALELKISGLM